MRGWWSVVARAATAAVVLLAASAVPAEASFPGAPGKILFRSAGQLWSVNPDGSDLGVFLDVPGGGESQPSWSADGQKIAFEHQPQDAPDPFHPDIWVANADGSGAHQIVTDGRHPSWSPDGHQIVFHRPAPSGCCNDLFVADADGSNEVNITQSPFPANENQPEWSPDGEHIAFWEAGEEFFYELRLISPTGGPTTLVAEGSGTEWSPFGDEFIVRDVVWGDQRYRVSIDGTQRTLLVPERAASPIGAWSPDGTRIAFFSHDYGLSLVSYDGTSRGPIRDPPIFGAGESLAWQPLPQPPAPRYVRPKGATPLYVPLVPSYAECTSPDREHGPPLAFGSCAAPQQTSTTATVGTADANGQPAKSSGYVRLDAQPGNPATPADEADLGIHVSLTDVRRTVDLADYASSLSVPLPVRLTYRAGGDEATMHEPAENTALFYSWPLRATAPCTATADPGVGAACGVTTSAEAVLGGNAVREGERGVWGLGQVRVYDSGPDVDPATAEDNELFAVQGVFVP